MEEKSKIIELPKILDKRGIEELNAVIKRPLSSLDFKMKLNGRIGFMMFRVVRLVAVMLI